jgi:hypothetical protein
VNSTEGYSWVASLQAFAWTASLLRNLSLQRDNQNLNIVTGADATHAESLLNLLKSILRFEPDAGVTIWDLGLSHEQVSAISQLSESFHIRKFDFKSHPKFMDIKVAAGHYAWKPVIIEETMKSKTGILMWLDAGNILTGRLHLLKQITISKGLFSPYSSGTIAQWTHPKTLAFVNLPNKSLGSNNCNGALVSILLSHVQAISVVRKWKELSLDQDCIAPIGSSRSNHRQDQAVLTVLCELNGFNKKGRYRELSRRYNVLTHQDAD